MSKASRERYYKRIGRSKAKSMNRMIDPISGLGGIQDKGSGINRPAGVWWCTTNPFLYGQFMRTMQIAYDLYYGDWGAGKAVNIPVDDTFREGFNFKYRGQDTDIDEQLQDEWDRLDITTQYMRGQKMERLLGGAVGVLGIDEPDDRVDENGNHIEVNSSPLDLSRLKKDCFKFINIVGRERIYKVEWQEDPTKQNYNKPLHYYVDGVSIHRSRLLIFDGNPISTHPRRDFWIPLNRDDSFGVSILSGLWNAFNRSELAQQGAAHLVQVASILVILQKGLQSLKSSRQGNRAIEELQRAAETMSLYKAMVFDGEDVDAKNISASFGSVPELVDKFLRVLAAGSDIPAERYLSESVGGLGNEGKSRLENYYNMVASKQHNIDTPRIKQQILPLLITSTFGYGVHSVKDFDIEWPPLWNLSDTEKAQVDTLNTNNILNLANAMNWGDEYTLAELKRKEVIDAMPDLEEMRRNQMQQQLDIERSVFGDEGSLIADERVTSGSKGIEKPSVTTITGIKRMPSVSAGGGLPQIRV